MWCPVVPQPTCCELTDRLTSSVTEKRDGSPASANSQWARPLDFTEQSLWYKALENKSLLFAAKSTPSSLLPKVRECPIQTQMYLMPWLVLFFFFATHHSTRDPSSPTRDQTRAPCTGRQNLNHWTAGEVHWLVSQAGEVPWLVSLDGGHPTQSQRPREEKALTVWQVPSRYFIYIM